jgi:hypothetical protein
MLDERASEAVPSGVPVVAVEVARSDREELQGGTAVRRALRIDLARVDDEEPRIVGIAPGLVSGDLRAQPVHASERARDGAPQSVFDSERRHRLEREVGGEQRQARPPVALGRDEVAGKRVVGEDLRKVGRVDRGQHGAPPAVALPAAVTTPDARPLSTTISVTGLPVTARPPWSSINRTSVSGSMPEPPIGVAQPNSCRPAVTDNGCMPVPGRSRSWIVANASHKTNDRTRSCSKRSVTTSCALIALSLA